jgi:phosphatidylserine/phosphatidylglycerophosphate/cardiolipin synthase-like enzyme
MLDSKDIDRVIRGNIARLRKAGVLTVRPGLEITDDQLTGKQAVVATVYTKRSKADLSSGNILPEKLGKYNVDVREATPNQRLRSHDPAASALTQATGRLEEREPEWPFEREMPSGKLLTQATSNTQKAFDRSKKTQPAMHRALARVQKKDRLDYLPPEDRPALERTELKATITAHVSPDAGYTTLSKFLAGTTESLLVGIYDFTSGSLLRDFVNDLAGNKTLQMVLDNPSPNHTRDQLDWQTRKELISKLGANAKIAWALDRSDAFASAWMFPYAYHIKLIVRDGDTLWLSSGNLNNSNQPNLSNPPVTEDRDWHVIIQNGELAQKFAYYLNYDYTSAVPHQTANAEEIEVTELEKTIVDARDKQAKFANPPRAETGVPPPLKNPVAAKTFRNVELAITPILTPDKLPDGQPQYLTKIIDLLNAAEKSIYIQLQYIESSKGDGSLYENLLKAIAQKIADGLDVKLIESKEWGLKWIEKMRASTDGSKHGVDLTANINLQDDVHNKGFVIDSKIVIVSSQNFSPAGVHDNRDAGVVIEHPEIAEYFEDIFLADWKNKSKPSVAIARRTDSRTSRNRKSSSDQKRTLRSPARPK